MTDFAETENLNTNGVTSYDTKEALPAYKKVHIPPGPVIKWYQQEMSYEEKFRFGVLTYNEYIQWMNELMLKEQEKNEKPGEEPDKSVEKPDTEWKTRENSEEDKNRDTFWSSDAGSRANISEGEYEKFLSENSVDVSNNTTLDIDDLIEEINDFTTARDEGRVDDLLQAADDDPAVQEVLNQVNKDIHGDVYLTQEEIEALFEAAQSGN